MLVAITVVRSAISHSSRLQSAKPIASATAARAARRKSAQAFFNSGKFSDSQFRRWNGGTDVTGQTGLTLSGPFPVLAFDCLKI